MPNKTINYDLTKPLGSENYDVEVQNSNMDKIDAALNTLDDGKAEVGDYPAIITTTWTGTSAPYSQAVTVPGITADDNPICDIVPSGTYATDIQMEDDWANVYRIVTSVNTVTFYSHAVTGAPIPVQIKAVR